MATVASISVSLFAETFRLQRDLATAQRLNRNYARRTQAQYAALASSLASLRFGIGAIFAGAGGAAIVNATNQFIQINNLLQASGVSAERLNDTFDSLQMIAQQTFSDFRDTARLFAVLNRNAERLEATEEQILVATRAIQQSFQLSGASVQEAQGAVRQLSQALASGVLRGQELNTVAEQAPLLFAAIADNIGVSFGELRRLAAEGMVTSQEVLDGIIRAAPEFQRQFGNITPTFQQLGEVFRTEILPPLAQLGTQLLPIFAGALQSAAAVVGVITDNFDRLAQVGRALATIIGVVLANRVVNAAIRGFTALRVQSTSLLTAWRGLNIATIRLAMQNNNLGFSVFRLTRSMTLASLASTGFRRAVLAASFALRAFRTILFSLGGPIGILLVALTEIGIALYNYFNPAMAEAVDEGEQFGETMDQINSAIDDLPEITRDAADGVNSLGEAFQATRSAANSLLVRIGEITQAEFERIRDLDQAQRLYDAQLITLEQLRAAVLRINEDFENTMRQLNEIGQVIQRSLEDGLVDAFETGRLSFRDLARDILREIIRIQVRLATTRFLTGFGGFRQGGGPVAAGQAYVVGEAGPELFVPNASGNIIPNMGSAPSGPTQVVYEINAVDARSFRDLVAQDPQFIHNVSERGRRRQGGLIR